MPADSVLEVGALIDLTELLPGLDKMATATQEATSQMTFAFDAAATSTTAALGTITGATADLGTEVIATGGILERMTGSVGAAFEGMGAVVKESMDTVVESVVAGSEEAGAALGLLSEQAKTAGAGFGAGAASVGSFSSALGALVGIGFVGSFVNSLVESEIRLAHLSEATGISIKSLAEWHEVLLSSGQEVGRFDTLLPRLASHIDQAAAGSKQQADALKNLGIDAHQVLENHVPLDQVLLKIADTLHANQGDTRLLGDAYLILGRQAGSLIGFLSQGSEELRKQLPLYSDIAKKTVENVQSSIEFEKQEEKLTVTLKSLGLDVIPPLTSELKSLNSIVETLGGNFNTSTAGVEKFALAFIEKLIPSVGLAISLLEKYSLHAAPPPPKAVPPPIGFESNEALHAEETRKEQAHATEILNLWKTELQDKLALEDATGKDAERIEESFWTEKLSTAQRGTILYQTALKELTKIQKELGSEVIDAAKEEFATLSSMADAFHSIQVREEIAYWQNILTNRKNSHRNRESMSSAKRMSLYMRRRSRNIKKGLHSIRNLYAPLAKAPPNAWQTY